jgi:transforming growth factor-beta-induced protein
MKTTTMKSKIIAVGLLMASFTGFSQTNVFDDIIATSPDHTYLKAALEQENLDVALQNSSATLTVFAPTDAAFTALATALNTNITGLLALPNLSDILTYHVLTITANAASINNGDVVNPISTTNSIKLTKTSMGAVYANQAMVTTPDVTADNGVLHIIDAVILPSETVVDLALDNGLTYLATAVIQQELLPVLTNPLANFTVFAPTNTAFDNLAGALGTDINGILALPNLTDVLAYHVMGAKVLAGDINNGDIATTVSTTNTLKITKTAGGNVYINQAMVTTPDVMADNGVVHVLDKVVLPVETVVDVALSSGFTYLAAAVAQEGLLPVLTDPLAKFTVFAPTNAAFDDLAGALNTDIAGLLGNPDLSSILTYHVLDSEVTSSSLSNGPVPTVNGENILVDLTSGVMINDASVTSADNASDNGVVHVINKVLLPSSVTSVQDVQVLPLEVYPNPVQNELNISNVQGTYKVMSITGVVMNQGVLQNNSLDVSNYAQGVYFIEVVSEDAIYQNTFIKK